jgi:hypothetical protein
MGNRELIEHRAAEDVDSSCGGSRDDGVCCGNTLRNGVGKSAVNAPAAALPNPMKKRSEHADAYPSSLSAQRLDPAPRPASANAPAR